MAQAIIQKRQQKQAVDKQKTGRRRSLSINVFGRQSVEDALETAKNLVNKVSRDAAAIFRDVSSPRQPCLQPARLPPP